MRIISIVGREGTIAMCDNATFKGEIIRDFSSKTAISLLHGVAKSIEKLNKEGVDYATIVVPNLIMGLAYKSTREEWVCTRKKKNGQPLTPEFAYYAQVIHNMLEKNPNIRILCGKFTSESECIKCYKASWECLNKATKITTRLVSGSTNF